MQLTGITFQALNGLGAVPGARLFSYAAGTLDPQATYTRADLLEPNENPVVCDAAGQAAIWLDPTKTYRLRLETPYGGVIADRDNIEGGSPGVAAVDLLADDGAALVGFLQAGTGAVSRSVLDKLRDTVSPEDFGAVGDGVANDLAALKRAVAFCLVTGARELRGQRVYAVSGALDISNFSAGFRLVLGGLVAHSTFPAFPSTPGGWKNATPMLSVGTVGGGQVGLNLEVLHVDGANKADVVLITNNGCGGSRFHLDRVRNANIIAKLDGNTAPTASNYFTGSYWEASTMGGYVHGDGSVCEGTTFDVGFIAGCKYGGLVFGDRSQYANVRGQLDFNGQWLTEMAVNSLAGFALGDQLNNASGSYCELLAAYTYQGQQFMLVIETKNVANGATNFAIGNNLTNGYSNTIISSISTANQNGNNRFFDIVSALTASQPFWRALILCPYLGGIVGSNLWNCTVDSGNSNSSYTTWIAGLEIYNSGSILSMADKRSSDSSFLDVTDTLLSPRRDVYLGGFAIRGPDTTVTIPNGTTANFLTLPAPPAGGMGSVWNVVAINPNDAAMRCKGTVYIAAGSTAGVLVVDSQANVTLTISGLMLRIAQGTGADKPMYMTATRVL